MNFELLTNTRRYASDISNAFNSVRSNIATIQNKKNRTQVIKAIEELKQQTGIQKISSYGLVLKLDEKNLLFSPQSDYSYRIAIQNRLNNQLEKDVVITNSGTVKQAKGFKDSSSLCEFLDSIFEKLDFPLLKLRRMLSNDNFLKFIMKYFSTNKLNTEGQQISNQIKTLFKNIDTQIQTIHNVPTRSKIKNGYSSICTGVKGSKQLEFLRHDGRKYSINVLSDHQAQENLVIRITKPDSTEIQNIIIEPDGQVLKHKNIGRKCNLGEKEFYTQEEIDSPVFQQELEFVKQELENYSKYIEESINQQKVRHEKYSTQGIGLIDIAADKMIKSIKTKYDALRAAMLTLKEAEEKNSAKRKFAFSTKAGSPSIIFENLSKDIKNIHLSFPVMKGKPCTKIIILDNKGNIQDSLFIYNSKLVKFDAKNTSLSKRNDTKYNYHSQSEVNESNINTYLSLLDKRLSKILKAISKAPKDWYKSN